MANITMYYKPTCPYCMKADKLLREKGVTDIEKINVESDPSAKAEMVSRSGGRTTVPQIFINDEHIGGCDDLVKLNTEGGLDSKLSAESTKGGCTGEGGCCGACGGKGSDETENSNSN
ncbi:glutaredoxin protein [Taylorella equigenitalis 14/56]|uniref:Glutaredoxin n=1 Tax=Taylorella equigenitalis 14/56 TaxID=1091497 RepID=I7IB99_9BURK|nr:glutaredoxin 3 [Taylorella equigenitalis]CCG18426.1 glutaredoxin protein [Taylorella equigenitalis 14/56]